MNARRKVLSQAADIASRLQAVLGDALLGCYLHGSAVLGAYVAGMSDLDILAVSTGRLSDHQKQDLARVLRQPKWRRPALELSVVTRAVAATPTGTPAFELHLRTGSDRKVVDGKGHPGDPDLVLHFAVCRARGRALAGPPPEEVFAPIPRCWVLCALSSELEWALAHAPVEYQVLNASRAWRYLEEGDFVSKLDGATWAREQSAESQLIDQAVARQRGDDAVRIAPDAAASFVRQVLARLQNAAVSEP